MAEVICSTDDPDIPMFPTVQSLGLSGGGGGVHGRDAVWCLVDVECLLREQKCRQFFSKQNLWITYSMSMPQDDLHDQNRSRITTISNASCMSTTVSNAY